MLIFYVVLATFMSLVLAMFLLPRLLKIIGITFSITRQLQIKDLSFIIRPHLNLITQIAISVEKIRFEINSFKLCLYLRALRIQLQTSQRGLLPIDPIKINQEAILLHNLLQLMQQLQPIMFKSLPQTIQQLSAPKGFWSSLKGIVNFCLMILLQLIQIRAQDSQIRIKDKLRDIDSRFRLCVRKLNVNSAITMNQDLNVLLDFGSVKGLYNSQGLWKSFLKLNGFKITLNLPFTFSINKSLNQSQLHVQIAQLQANVNPSNLISVYQLKNQEQFVSYLKLYVTGQTQLGFKRKVIEGSPQRISVKLNKALLKLNQLYQAELDSNESRVYLRNIQFGQLAFNQLEMTITKQRFLKKQIKNQVSLKSVFVAVRTPLGRYDVLELPDFKAILSSTAPLDSFDTELLSKITHGRTKINCSPEGIAFLAKIHQILKRIRQPQYKIELYQPYFHKLLQNVLKDILKTPQAHQRYLKLRQFRLRKLQKFQLLEIQNHKTELKEVISSHIIQYNIPGLEFNMLADLGSLILKIEEFQYKKIIESKQIVDIIKAFKTQVQCLKDGQRVQQFDMKDSVIFIRQSADSYQFQYKIQECFMSHSKQTINIFLGWYCIIKTCFQLQDKKSQSLRKKDYLVKHKKSSFIFQNVIGYFTINPFIKLVLKCQLFNSSAQRVIEDQFVNRKTLFRQVNLSAELGSPYLKKNAINIINIVDIKEFRKGVFFPKVDLGETALISELIRLKKPRLLFQANMINAQGIIDSLIQFKNAINPLYQEAFPQEDLTRNAMLLAQIRKQTKSKIINNYKIPLEVEVNDVQVNLQQDSFEAFNLRFQSMVRQYFSKTQNYSEVQIIKEMNARKARPLSLVKLNLNSLRIKFTHNKIFQTFSEIKNFVSQFSDEWENLKLIDFQSISTQAVQLSSQTISLTLRDYPKQIVFISSLNIGAYHLEIQRYQQQKKTIVKTTIGMGQVKSSIGLCMASGLKAFEKRVKQLWPKKQTKKQQQPSKNELIEFRNNNYLWLHFERKQPFTLSLLLGQYPYQSNSLNLQIQKMRIIFFKQSLLIDCSNLTLLKVPKIEFLTPIVNVPSVQIQLEFVWRTNNKLHFQIKTIIDQDQGFQSIPLQRLNKQIFYIHLQKNLISQLDSIFSLRVEYLRLLGIKLQNNSRNKTNFLSKTLQIINFLTAPSQLQTNDRPSTLGDILRSSSLELKMEKLHFLVTNFPNSETMSGIHLTMKGLHLLIQVRSGFYQDSFKWKSKKIIGKIQNMLGSFLDKNVENHLKSKRIFGIQIDNSYRGANQLKMLIQAFKEGSFDLQNQVQVRHAQRTKKEQQRVKFQFNFDQRMIFLFSQQLRFQSPKLGANENQCVYKTDFFMEYKGLKLVASTIFKEVISKLRKDFFQQNFELSVKQSPIIKSKNKFKEAAKRIIQDHKRTSLNILRNQVELYNAVALIKNPQFAIVSFQQNYMIVLSSTDNCLFRSRQQYLPFDVAKQDTKNCFQLLFQSFQIHVSRGISRQLNEWLQNGKGYQQILSAKKTIFTNQNFAKEQCLVDYSIRQLYKDTSCLVRDPSQKFMWGGLPRVNLLKIKLTEVKSQLDKADLASLKNMIDFITQAVHSQKVIQQDTALLSMQHDLQDLKKAQLVQRIMNKGHDVLTKNRPRLKFTVQLKLKNATFVLKNRIEFMKLAMDNLLIQNNIYSNQFYNFKFKVQKIMIQNLTENQAGEYRKVLCFQEAGPVIHLEKSFYKISLQDRPTLWNFNLHLQAKVAPVNIHLTQHCYQHFYQFLFGDKKQDQKEKVFMAFQFYQSICMRMDKLTVSFKSSSKLKSLNRLVVTLNEFRKGNKFYNSKQLFDSLGVHIVKQLGGQFFSIVGQKVFGLSHQ